jgi:Ca2+-binding RTX toxin-like protein
MKKWRVVFVALVLVIGASVLTAQAQSCGGLPASPNGDCLCFGSCAGTNPDFSCVGGPGASTIITIDPAIAIGGSGNDLVVGLQFLQAVCGGPGRDVVVGVDLVGFADGQGGNDVVVGAAGIAQIARGGSGNDVVITLDTGSGGITSGDEGNDVCVNVNGDNNDSVNGTCELEVDI